MDGFVGPCEGEVSRRRATCRSATGTATGRTRSRSSWTTCGRASTSSSADATSSRRRRRRSGSARCSGGDAPATFAHHRLIRRPDGRKLSKADGATGIRELRAAGRRAPAVIGEAAAAIGLDRCAPADRGDRGGGALPGTRPRLGLGPVLDLPGVVERVPGDPARGVARRPLARRRSASRPTAGAATSSIAARIASTAPATARSWARHLDAHLAGVGVVGADPRGRSSCRVSRPPPRGPLRSSAGAAAATRSKTVHAASTSAASRSASAAETGRRSRSVIADGTPKSVPPSPVTVSTISRSIGVREGQAGRLGDDRVAGRRGEQRRLRELRVLAAPAPAGPVERPGEGLLRAALHADPEPPRRRHAPTLAPWRSSMSTPTCSRGAGSSALRASGGPYRRRRPARRPRGDLPRRDAGRVPAAGPLRLRPADRDDGRGRHRRLDRLADLPERLLGRRDGQHERRARGERLDGRGAARLPATGSAGSRRCRGSTRRARSRSSPGAATRERSASWSSPTSPAGA